jgi:hypothetical protein
LLLHFVFEACQPATWREQVRFHARRHVRRQEGEEEAFRVAAAAADSPGTEEAASMHLEEIEGQSMQQQHTIPMVENSWVPG